MSKTIYYTATSLDGFIADSGNSLDWLMQFEQTEGSDYAEFIQTIGAVAMGSTTYEWVIEHHIKPDSPTPQPWPHTQPTWVFSSRQLRGLRDADVRFVRGDVRPVHEAMRREAAGKDVWVVGGGDLAGQFYDHGLLDELIITVAPVTLGGGAALLPRKITSPALQLLSARAWGGVFVRLHYAVRR